MNGSTRVSEPVATITASGSSFSYVAAVVAALVDAETAAVAVAAAAMIAAAANRRILGIRQDLKHLTDASRSYSAGIFLSVIHRMYYTAKWSTSCLMVIFVTLWTT